MTVAELIKELEKMPQDKEVVDYYGQYVEGCYYMSAKPIDKVKIV